MTFEERIQRAEQARELMQHPLLAEAFILLEERAVQDWKNAFQPDIRENAWLRYTALNSLRAELKSWIDDGKWAEADQRIRKSL